MWSNIHDDAHDKESIFCIQVEHFKKASPKIGLKIDINAPVIKIPLNSLSGDGIIVDLGSLIIRNKLEHQEKEKENSNKTRYNAVLTDNISVTLKSFSVKRFVIIINSPVLSKYSANNPYGANN